MNKGIEELKEEINNLSQQCLICNKECENEQLKQQLEESEKLINILEEYKFCADNIIQFYADKCDNYYQQLEDIKKESKRLKFDLAMFKSVNEIINRYGIEKAREILFQTEITKKQDKISFAVAELKKTLSYAEDILNEALKNSSLNNSFYDKLLDKIDNQIENLEKEKGILQNDTKGPN